MAEDSHKRTITVQFPSWNDPHTRVGDVAELYRELDELSGANVDPSTRLASVTKEAAKLNAAVAESSSNAMLAAAQVVADALGPQRCGL